MSYYQFEYFTSVDDRCMDIQADDLMDALVEFEKRAVYVSVYRILKEGVVMFESFSRLEIENIIIGLGREKKIYKYIE